MSCLGRERIFQYFSEAMRIPVALLRLNSATYLSLELGISAAQTWNVPAVIWRLLVLFWSTAMTAALFISEFTDGLPWVHMDIAGTAWAEEAKPYLPKGATGVAVRTLAELALGADEWRKKD